MYRDGTYDLPGDAEGTGWSKVDGMMVWVASGEGVVWGVSANGELWYRAGIDQNNPSGTNWFRMETRPGVEGWKQAVSNGGDSLWGIDGGENLRCRERAGTADIAGRQSSKYVLHLRLWMIRLCDPYFSG